MGRENGWTDVNTLTTVTETHWTNTKSQGITLVAGLISPAYLLFYPVLHTHTIFSALLPLRAVWGRKECARVSGAATRDSYRFFG